MTSPSYIDTGVTPGDTYYYEVTAVNSSGNESAPSFEAVANNGPLTTPIISEFVASNSDGLADQAGGHPDWIELYNPSASAISLNGYYLTDKTSNLTEWQIPNVSIAAGGFLVVFADGENLTNPAQELHTNFSLAAAGEYFALVAPDGTTILSSYTFPAQRDDIAYGVAMAQAQDSLGNLITSYGAVGYLNPTPDAVNGSLIGSAIVAEPTFDHPDGFYSTSFPLVISTTTPARRSTTRSTARCRHSPTARCTPGRSRSAANRTSGRRRSPRAICRATSTRSAISTWPKCSNRDRRRRPGSRPPTPEAQPTTACRRPWSTIRCIAASLHRTC